MGDYMSPFSVDARKHGKIDDIGVKPDDITVIVSQVKFGGEDEMNKLK